MLIFRLRLSIVLCLLLALILINAPKTQALGEFTSHFNHTYIIDQDGLATVTLKISLTNNFASTFVKEYSLTFGSTRLKNIHAQTSSGSQLAPSVVTINGQTQVNLDFPYPVVGKGKTQAFSLTFQDPDAAQKVGHVLEINLPKLQQVDQVDDYTVTLLVPQSFGPPSLVSPVPDQQLTDAVYTKLVFNQEAAINKGISAQFGDRQIFTYTLAYHLENPTVTPIETQIALPPDTPYQQNYLDFLSIPPLNINTDADGNWIATYLLEPKAKTDITAQGKIVTYLKPLIPIPSFNPNLKDYLLEQNYWPVNDDQIRSLTAKYFTPQAIYDYLVSTFTYDYSRLDNRSTERLGATRAFHSPTQALCLEFTDAFITLNRASGTPARLLTGYAYTENSKLRPLSLVQDVLHAWPEYYDFSSSLWRPVDPTWGNTTGGVDYFHQLDLNHVVFAIQGLHPDQPFPAGYYKISKQPTKDVDLQFSTVLPQENIQILFSPNQPLLNRWGFSDRSTLNLTNQSTIALYGQKLALTSPTLKTTIPSPVIPLILPYQTVSIPFYWQSPSPLVNRHQLSATIYDQTQVLNFTQRPFYQSLFIPIFTLVSLICLVIGAKFFWRLLVSHRR